LSWEAFKPQVFFLHGVSDHRNSIRN